MSKDTQSIRFDETQWPILIIRFSGSPTDDEFTQYLQRYETYMHGEARYAVMLVTEPHASMTKARHAKQQARWIGANQSRIRRHCVGTAFVLPSSLMRGVLRAILSMQSMPVEYAVFSTESQASTWCRARLDAI
jgi:hypothetical protein